MFSFNIDPNAPDSDSDSDVEMLDVSDPKTLCEAWDILLDFAQSEWTLAQAHTKLENLLGRGFNELNWQAGLDAANGEGDLAARVQAVKALMPNFSDHTVMKSTQGKLPCLIKSKVMEEAEEKLMTCVRMLKDHNRIRGDIPSVDSLLDPVTLRRQTTLQKGTWAFVRLLTT